MAFAAISAGIGGASLLFGVGKSISQSNQANAIDKSNPRPTYQIPEEYRQNVALANQMARIGLPQQQYNNQVNGINQNQAGAVAALNNSANPGAGLASVVRAGNAAIGNLNAQDAATRVNNQRFAIGQNAQLGQQELAAQQYNKFDKYTEDFNKAAALRGAANQNMQNSFNSAAGLAGSLAGSYNGSQSATPSQNGGGGFGEQIQPTGAFAYGQPFNNAYLGWGAMMPQQSQSTDFNYTPKI